MGEALGCGGEGGPEDPSEPAEGSGKASQRRFQSKYRNVAVTQAWKWNLGRGHGRYKGPEASDGGWSFLEAE